MLKISSLDIIPVVLIQTINGALHGLGKTNISVIAFAVGGVVKLILNIALINIPTIGLYGAIIATIISHIVSFLICFFSLRLNIKNMFSFKLFINSYGKKGYKTIKKQRCM